MSNNLPNPLPANSTVRERLKDFCADPSATELLFADSLDAVIARLDKAGI